MVNQKAKLQTRKNRKQNKWRKKRKSKKGKTWKTWTCPFAFFLHLFCLLDLLFCCFYFTCFFPGKQQNRCKIKANRESKINATKCKWTSPFFSHVFSLFNFPFFAPCFSPLILLLCFLDFADLLFAFFHFFHLSRFFSSLPTQFQVSFPLRSNFGLRWPGTSTRAWLTSTTKGHRGVCIETGLSSLSELIYFWHFLTFLVIFMIFNICQSALQG